VGRHVSAELERRGYRVRGLDLADQCDALDLFRVDTSRYELVVHAAASSPHRAAIDSEPMHLARNLQLDAAMFDWAVRTGQGRVLYLSSCAVLDGPDDYGWAKLTGERLAASARRSGLGVTVVRPFSGYGSDQSENFPFRAMIERARRREDPFQIWGDGLQVRDWIHIDDVVAGMLAVAESGTTEPVSLCTGIGTSMTTLALMACAEVGYRPRFEFLTDRHPGVAHRVGDPTLLHQFYVPQVSLEQGVKRAIAEGANLA
jgi:nucleoside-diphosphate-sugar epimerase